MNWINTRPSTQDRVSFEGYAQRYQLNPENVKAQAAFKKYLLYKIDKIYAPINNQSSAALKKGSKGQLARKQDPTISQIQIELRSSSLSFKRLKYLAYLVSLTPAEREQLQNMVRSFSLTQRNLPSPRLFARGFHQMAHSATQWNLASELQSNTTFESRFEETLKAHPFNEAEKEIEKMEQDLAEIPNSSLLKQYLMERRVVDREGRLAKSDTPLETKQMIESYLQVLSHVLQLEVDQISTVDLKEWDKKVSLIIYNRFLSAVEKNPKWKKNLLDVQSSDKSAAEKIQEIKRRLSTENQVQKLLEALSFKVENEDLENFLADPILSSLGVGFPERAAGLFLEVLEAKLALKGLYLEVIRFVPETDKAQIQSTIRSKVENLCSALGILTPQRHTTYELYTSYFRAFKERCSELQNPLQILLAKEAHLNRDVNVLELMRPKFIPINTAASPVSARDKLSPTGSGRTSVESPALEDSSEFHAFISDKGLQNRAGTLEYRELLTFARDLYKNPVQCLLEINVQEWTPKAREECLKWLLGSFFVECLDVDFEPGDNANLETVLASFGWHAGEELERLGLPFIYVDMLTSSLASGNVRRLKLIADEIAYARYREVYPHTEVPAFKEKTVSEKVEHTKKYLKKLEDKTLGSYRLAYMELLPMQMGEVSPELQSSIDLYLAGSHKENAFYKYLKENGLDPLTLLAEKRLPYLFYVQKQFVKEQIQSAQRPNYINKGGAALACELKATTLLDLRKLDLIAQLIESGEEVDIDYCLSLYFHAAARKLFMDSVLNNSTFDVVGNFIKIKELSEQKALLNTLEKAGHRSVIKTIILKGTLASYLSGYEWLRDRIKTIPENEFMSFFLSHFSVLVANDTTSLVLKSRQEVKKSCDDFQCTIKQEQFIESPVRALLEKEGIIDGSGDLVWNIASEETFISLDLCLLTQRDFIKMNRNKAQLEKRANSLQMGSSWIEILTEVNADMKDALEKGISLELSSEEVEALIRRASNGAAGNSIFSDYLKEIKLEEIKGLPPRKHYELYVTWVNNLSKYFQRKLDRLQGTDLWMVAYQAHQALQQDVRDQDWNEVNTNARTILLTESVTQPKTADQASNWAYNELGRIRDLPGGFVQKSLVHKNGVDLLKAEEDQIDSTVRADIAKWIQEIDAETGLTIRWLNQSSLKSLISEINSGDLSISEKKLKIDSLMIALTKVLNREFERLKMSPSYKDLIERVFHDGNGSLCDFLLHEAVYGNYQHVIGQIRDAGGHLLIANAAETLTENDTLRNKIAKTMIMLTPYAKESTDYKNLLDAISLDRLTELVKKELESNLGRAL